MSDETEAAIKAAQEALWAVEREQASLQREIREEKDAAVAIVDARFADRVNAMRERVSSASRALKEVKDATPGHPWTGKRVFCEYHEGPSWQRNLVREEGVVEMRRQNTQFPANSSGWRLPELGQPFVRLLKKDGSPGIKFEPFNRGHRPWKLVDDHGDIDPLSELSRQADR